MLTAESLFERDDLHPMVFYHLVKLLVGNPYFLDREQIEKYRGKQAKQLITNLNVYCQEEIMKLLQSATMSRENEE